MIMAFDPGSVTGAYGVLDSDGNFVTCGDLPTTPFGGSGKIQVNSALLGKLVDEIKPDLAVVEWVNVMPKQGASSGFAFGVSFGIILGVLGGARIPYLLVTPGKWKKAMGLSKDKDSSRTLALRRWPNAGDYLALKKHHGRAESLLLAEYQRCRNILAS